ncbi:MULTISPECIES: universal stress protein [Nocardia]|uniref:universal stress protein n=1 Tax=Nocardia TaxID=1817 RepID=UPI000D69D7BD|nr:MULTISPECIES: universal stress protein [Nocardia]
MNTRSENPDSRHSAPIVVGVDGSEGSRLAVRWAAEAAARRHRPLLIVHGIDLLMVSSTAGGHDVMAPSVIDAVRTHGTTVVGEAAETARQVASGLDVETELSDESPTRLLIDYSRTAHLVVLGATGNAGAFAHLGSTLLAVTSHGHGSIVVVRTDDPDRKLRDEGPVVVGVDGSPVSEAAVAAAFAEASARGAELVAVHSWSDWDAGQFAGKRSSAVDVNQLETAEFAILAERTAGWQEKYPDVRVIRKVYLAGPSAQLMQWSMSAQLVVVGSRGRGGFTGLLMGSTSNFLVQHAHCPVLVAHSA